MSFVIRKTVDQVMEGIAVCGHFRCLPITSVASANANINVCRRHVCRRQDRERRPRNGSLKTMEMDGPDEIRQVCPLDRDRLLVFGPVAGGDGPARTPAPDPSHTNIPPLFIENKHLPASHPFSPRYNEAGMILAPVQSPRLPPEPAAPLRPPKSENTERTHSPSQLIPNQTTYPTPSRTRNQPVRSPPAAPSRFPYNERCP
jgi:hypothetical protein